MFFCIKKSPMLLGRGALGYNNNKTLAFKVRDYYCYY